MKHGIHNPGMVPICCFTNLFCKLLLYGYHSQRRTGKRQSVAGSKNRGAANRLTQLPPPPQFTVASNLIAKLALAARVAAVLVRVPDRNETP